MIGSRLGIQRRSAIMGFLLFLPALILIGAVILKPLIEALWMSLHENNLLRPFSGMRFVGIKNFSWLLSADWFVPTLLNTVILSGVVVAIQLILALALAVLIDFDFPGRGLVRGMLLTPWAVPVVVAALVWQWMYDPTYGAFNLILMKLGLVDRPIVWLGTTYTALPSAMVALVWKGMPFMLLAMMAGLQQVDASLREAARVDGARPWQEFRHVVLPSLRHIIAIMVLLRTIFLFNHFDLLYLLTGGGPGDATLVFSIQTIRLGFNSFQFGRAAAITTFMFLILVAGSLVYFRIAKMGREEVE